MYCIYVPDMIIIYIRGESVLACRTLLPQHPPVKRYRCTRPCTAEVITVEDFAVLLFRSVSPLVSFFPDPLEAGRGDMLAHCVFGSCPQARTSLPLWALAWFGSGSASPLHCQLSRQPSSALPLHPLVVCWCCHPPQPTSASCLPPGLCARTIALAMAHFATPVRRA